MKTDDRNVLYIQRILEYCERIEAAVSRFGDSYDAFIKDADYRDAVCMNIFRIGELANQLSDDFKEKHNDVPWDQMYGIRNRLAHVYIKIDDSIVWDTVKNDIPIISMRDRLASSKKIQTPNCNKFLNQRFIDL